MDSGDLQRDTLQSVSKGKDRGDPQRHTLQSVKGQRQRRPAATHATVSQRAKTEETRSKTRYSQFQRAKTESGTQPERSVATHEGSPVRHSHNVSRQTFQDQRQRADAFRMLEGKAMLARESRFQQNRSSKMSERRRHSQMSRSLWSMLPLDPPCGKCSGESFRVTQRVQTRPQSHTEK